MSGEGEGLDEQTPQPSGHAQRRAGARSLFGRAVLYPNVYAWYVFLASLDVMLTFLILSDLFSEIDVYAPPRGTELNPLANWITRIGGLPGIIAFKFALVILVVCICEIVGRRKHETGRRLAKWAVAISAIPVVVALVQMALDVYSWVLP
ncbi:MAG TPA: hypothetical protein VM487_03995 [Phycisphaerae bacterium]|nr:hypothetical protein [Phycisphaerae bacterium]